jgi:ABC-type nickel/cobalt efflux system permease component RcnA
MINFLSILVLGFFLGTRHATDPDHVIAVTTIVSRNRTVKHAAWVGALWGIGHTLTILVVGGSIILFGWVIPPRIGLSMEFSVGLMLILLGFMNLTGILQWVSSTFWPGFLQDEVHGHPHSHGDYIHTHLHAHNPETHSHDPEHTPVHWFDRHFGRIGFYQVLRPLIVGIVHGLAGSAAVALLVLATIRDPRWALAYLFVFGVGTIVGMMLITAAIGLPFTRGTGSSRLHHGFRVASGVISLAFGIFLVYQFGLVKGLFTSHPNWTPH